jgi:hypothetical protein
MTRSQHVGSKGKVCNFSSEIDEKLSDEDFEAYRMAITLTLSVLVFCSHIWADWLLHHLIH